MIRPEQLVIVCLRRIAIAVFVFSTLSIVAFIGWFAFKLEYTLSSDVEEWGQFGDYVGGIGGTLLAAATLGALAISVLIQLETYRTTKEELKGTRRALAKELMLSRRIAATTSFQSVIEILLSLRQGEPRWLEFVNGIPTVFAASLTGWEAGRTRVRLLYQFRERVLGPFTKLVTRLLTIVESDVPPDARTAMVETLAAILNDRELRAIRVLAHFNVPNADLHGWVADNPAFALMEAAEKDLAKKLAGFPRPAD